MPLLGRAKIVGLARAITSRRREPFDSGKDAVRKVEEKNPLGGGRVLGRSMRDELERGGALACRLPVPVRIAEGDLARGPDGVPLWARRRLWLMAAECASRARPCGCVSWRIRGTRVVSTGEAVGCVPHLGGCCFLREMAA